MPIPKTPLLLVATLAVCFILPLTSHAQSSGAGRKVNSQSVSRGQSARGPLINVEFQGGTLQQYLELLGSLVDDDGGLNVVVDDAAKQLPMPSISFKQVSLPAAVEILEQLAPNDRSVRVTFKNSIFSIRSIGQPNANFSSAASRAGGAPQRTYTPVRKTVVLSVEDILKTKSRDDLLSAIEIGLELVATDNSTANATLKLHAETGLLFAKGNTSQLRIISDTVSQLAASSVNSQRAAQYQQNSARSRGAGASNNSSSQRDK